MLEIKYLKGDATLPQADKEKNVIIAHVCNDKGGWGSGFVLAISKRWKEPEANYRKWKQEEPETFMLGENKIVQVEPNLYVANMIAQSGYKSIANPVPLSYKYLRKCLNSLAMTAKELEAEIHMPRIGAGLGGGNWDIIEEIIYTTISSRDIQVVVYDYDC